MTPRIVRITIAAALLGVATTALAVGSTDDGPAVPVCAESGITTGVTAEGVRFGLGAVLCEPAAR